MATFLYKLGRAAFMARRCGASRFQQLLDALAQREARYLAAG